jgi:type IV pilus assembly protein PilC
MSGEEGKKKQSEADSGDQSKVRRSVFRWKKPGSGRRIRYLSNLEAAAFAGQMAVVLKSGISGIEGITLMYENSEDPEERKILKQILDEAAFPGGLAPAMEKTGVFPTYMVRLVRIGERTGNLDTVMAALEEYYENEEEMRRESSDAMLYPLILTCVMLAVIVVLVLRVIPVFEQVYRELGTELTGLPLVLKEIGDGIRTYSISFLLILGSLVLIIFVSRLTEEGRTFWHNFGRHFKGARREYEETDAYRFSRVMSMTLSSGLTPEEGMDMAIDLISEKEFRDKIAAVRKDMDEGISMAQSLKDHGIFSGMYARMVILGEKSGSLDQVLGEISGFYRQQAQERLSRFISSIEPILIILLSLLTGAILLSVMLPLLGVISSL